MSKRKREPSPQDKSVDTARKGARQKKTSNGYQHPVDATTSIQIIVGTYEKVLHGMQATIVQDSKGAPGQGPAVKFADTFLLSPHGSAIRCLAISPPSSSDTTKSQKVILASGSSDQIINLYHITREAPSQQSDEDPQMPTLTGNKVEENTRNRELGSLQHHSGGINALHFPTRSKLLSAAEDNTIAVARTRDWTVLSTIKAPIPKAHGRPSGDTAPLGGTPAGVNDFAIHPSMKLMVSVGKGEKCMRLWNLVTGKKAGVLNFERDFLRDVGEGRWASGEGRKVRWDGPGEEFVVAFERGCVVFGMDCKPKCRVLPVPSSKIHQIQYLSPSEEDGKMDEVLAVSTEDGRVIFYSTTVPSDLETTKAAKELEVPMCQSLCQLGGITEGLTGRVKDFEILRPPQSEDRTIVTGSSDGAIRIWQVDAADLTSKSAPHKTDINAANSHAINGEALIPKQIPAKTSETKQVGRLLSTYEAGNRITCLKAFIMVNGERPMTNGNAKTAEHESS